MMSYWSEITNDFTETNPSPKDGDVLAVNYIDAWREGEEEGNVIAKVLLSKHGDVMVDYVEGIARIDDLAQEVIADSKAKIVEVFKARQSQHEQSPDACASLGKSVYVRWDRLDFAVNSWAHEYFGSHVCASGSRDEESFGIELTGLKADDFEAFSKLYEEFDKGGDYEPEFDFEHDSTLASTLPSQPMTAYSSQSAAYTPQISLNVWQSLWSTLTLVLVSCRPSVAATLLTRRSSSFLRTPKPVLNSPWPLSGRSFISMRALIS